MSGCMPVVITVLCEYDRDQARDHDGHDDREQDTMIPAVKLNVGN